MSHVTGHPQAQPGGRPQGTPAGGPAIQRQFVSFAFFKLDPAFRRLDAAEKAAIREEFVKAAGEIPTGMICLTYSTVAMRADTDFCLWRISGSSDDIQAHQATLNKTRLAAWLSQPHALLSMTKRSMYVDKLDPFHAPESRAILVPGRGNGGPRVELRQAMPNASMPSAEQGLARRPTRRGW